MVVQVQPNLALLIHLKIILQVLTPDKFMDLFTSQTHYEAFVVKSGCIGLDMSVQKLHIQIVCC
jgi:hypothetical protein